jgi:hypothetical protein
MYTPYKMMGSSFYGKETKKGLPKKLIGNQHRLPEELKAKIEAAPEPKKTATPKKGCKSKYRK